MTDQPKSRIEGGRRLREGARSAPPLASIITVVFNAMRELPPLFESIVAQLGEDVEWIVVDGGSTDGTVEILRQFDRAIDYWLSETDSGIYEAMNKGIAAAAGEYVLHLNAGDRLRCIPRDQLRKCLADKIDVACFAVDMEGFGIHRPRAGLLLRITNAWHHQGVFYRRANDLAYNTQFRIYGDFDLNQRMVKAGKSVRISNTVVAEQFNVGASGSMATYVEQYEVIKQNFGPLYVCLAHLWRYIWPSIPAIKRWVGR